MASRTPPSKKKRATGAKSGARKPSRTAAAAESMPTLDELKRARAKLDAALVAMERRRRK